MDVPVLDIWLSKRPDIRLNRFFNQKPHTFYEKWVCAIVFITEKQKLFSEKSKDVFFSPKIFWYTVGKENGRIFGIRHFYLAGYPTKSISCPTLFCLGAYMKSPVTLLIIFTKFAYSAATSTLVWSFIGLLNFSGLQELVFPTWYLLYSRS